MPFVRFSRDKRGYEHVYLVHATHGRGQAPARVLYWFRTPPGIRVGREPFDEEARRALQAEYPNLEFDWKRIVNARIPPPEPEHPRERRRAERAMRRAQAEDDRTENGEVQPEAAAPQPAAEVTARAIDGAAREGGPSPSPVAQPPGDERRRRRRRGGRRRHKGRAEGAADAPNSSASAGGPPVADMSHLPPVPDATLDREEE